jgi:branched-chain amino acid transport system substrate-binding protein
MALLATACGSSAGSKQSGNNASESKSPAGASTATPNAATSGQVTFGLGNEETGPASFPATQQGAEVAANYLNANGGIAGKKVHLVTCDLQNTDQASQKCGQQFASNSSIVAVGVPLTQTGGPLYAALTPTGKPIQIGIAITTVDYTAHNAYSYATSNNGLTQTYADFAKAKGAKTVVLFYTSATSGVVSMNALAADLKPDGIKLDAISIPTTATDVIPQISASSAKTADLVILNVTAICGQIDSAMRSLGIKPKMVLGVVSCYSSQQLTAGSQFGGWYVDSPTKIPEIGKGIDPQVTTFLDAWDKYGPGGTPGTFAEVGWATIMNMAMAIKAAKVTDLTSANINAALKSYTAPSVFGPTQIKCPGPASEPAICASGAVYYQFVNGKLKPVHS